jgi:hypothetical protein
MEILTMELTVLTWLMIKHFVADYFLQTPWMIQGKADYGAPGGIVHAGEHALLTGIVISMVPGIGFWWGLTMAVLDFVLHYHVDWCKSNYLRGNFTFSPMPMDQEDTEYWWAMGTDQFAHYMTYVLIVVLSV